MASHGTPPTTHSQTVFLVFVINHKEMAFKKAVFKLSVISLNLVQSPRAQPDEH